MTSQRADVRGRLQLVLLAVVFFGPLLLAIGMYFTGNTTAGGSTVNYGQFIDPPLSLDAKLHFDSGTRGRWTLMFKSGRSCDDVCEKALIDIRQIRLATGREIDRIERLMIAKEAPGNIEQIREQHPGLLFSFDIDTDSVLLTRAFESLDTGLIYIMDPLGNVVLRYNVPLDRKAFLGDLKKLLKASRIG